MEEFRKFRQARSTATRAIRKAKNDWLQKKASEIKEERFGGRKCGRLLWRCSVDADVYSHVGQHDVLPGTKPLHP